MPRSRGSDVAAEPASVEDDVHRDPKRANVVYHDWEAATYDQKWSISFDQRCIDYARDRFVAVAGRPDAPYRQAVEIGAGTGFFMVNLQQAGVISRGIVTDISSGMVGQSLANAAAVDVPLAGLVADAESLPFADASVDLVIGHAVLHHLPDVEQGLREVLRILRPGGRFVFAGEPTSHGDVVARRLSRLTWWTTTRVTRLPGVRGRWSRPDDELTASSAAAALEASVDLHTFNPGELMRSCLRAGAIEVSTVTEELTASWFGWPVRTFECAVNPERLGWRWAHAAYRGWQGLAWVDRNLLDHVVPDELFYNVSVTGVRP